MNASLSGVDLAGALLEVSLGGTPSTQPTGREGVQTRLGLMGLLDAARRRNKRRDVLFELALLARGAGRYRGATEELTPIRTDPWSVVPLGFLTATLLLAPSAVARLSEQTVSAYSLSPDAIRRLHEWRAVQGA
jgi:hypothetical protein